MRISGELTSENESKVVGLPKEKNLNFWRKERNFNFFWYRVVSSGTLVLCLMFCIPLLLLPFDVSWYSYVLMQAFNAFHCTYTVFFFLHSVYTTSIFILQIMYFFSLKFKYIRRRLARLDDSGAKKLDNRRLVRLVLQFNRVQLELIETNNFFKRFLGTNMIFFFSMAVIFLFLGIYVDWLLRVALLSTVFVMYLTIILAPFSFADLIKIQVNQLTLLQAIDNSPLVNFLFSISRVAKRNTGSKTFLSIDLLAFGTGKRSTRSAT